MKYNAAPIERSRAAGLGIPKSWSIGGAIGAARTEFEEESASPDVFVRALLSFSFTFPLLSFSLLGCNSVPTGVETSVRRFLADASPAFRWLCSNFFDLLNSFVTRLCLITPLRV